MRSIGRILGATRVLWPLYSVIVACSVLIAASALVSPFIIRAAVDTIVDSIQGGSVAASAIIWLAAALLLNELLGAVITNVGGYFGDTMAARVREILSTRYFDKLLRLPQRYFDDEATGKIISRLNRSITTVSDFMQMFANGFFTMLITVFSVLVITGFYFWPLALLLASIIPIYTWLTALTSNRWQRLEGRKNTEIDLAGGRFAEVVGQIRVVKSFVQERRELDIFASHYDRSVGLTREQSRWWHYMDTVRRAALAVVFFGLYALIFMRTYQGHQSVGDMVLLVQLIGMAKQPVTSMSFLVDTSQRAIAGSRDYFETMAQPVDRTEIPALVPSRETDLSIGDGPALVFDDVTFGYEDTDVLSGISFAVPRGARVALVSESGGGKTTLVSLLLGLHRPRQGRLLIGGRSASDLDEDQIRANVGVVFQDASLFSGTIRENIAYARPDATDEEVVRAANRAHAHTFITRFKDGYDSTIGERGLKLSGGQKQRIAVARAILKDAPILVLDEATSALDTKSERAVHSGLEELMTDRTSIIIAHRLSTIAHVDTIVTLRNGRVDEIGSPPELANSGGIYAELLDLQASSGKKDLKRLRQYDILG